MSPEVRRVEILVSQQWLAGVNPRFRRRYYAMRDRDAVKARECAEEKVATERLERSGEAERRRLYERARGLQLTLRGLSRHKDVACDPDMSRHLERVADVTLPLGSAELASWIVQAEILRKEVGVEIERQTEIRREEKARRREAEEQRAQAERDRWMKIRESTLGEVCRALSAGFVSEGRDWVWLVADVRELHAHGVLSEAEADHLAERLRNAERLEELREARENELREREEELSRREEALCQIECRFLERDRKALRAKYAGLEDRRHRARGHRKGYDPDMWRCVRRET